MERRAHDRRADDGSAFEGALEVGDGQVREARPERDVGLVGVLRLEAGEPADGRRDVAGLALEESLAVERRAVEAPRRKSILGHGMGGSQPSGASSKPSNEKAGATMQPASAQTPSGRAACHAPAGTTACGCSPSTTSPPSRTVVTAGSPSAQMRSSSGSPADHCQTSAASTRCQCDASSAASR